jgi:AcrR family transcriptional regulator
MQANPFDQGDLARKKKDQLLGTASRLFNLNGIEGTSVSAIAAELGMTKGVLYHYFADKDALIVQSYERAFEQFERFISIANEQGRDGLSKALIIHHLNCQAQLGNAPPLMPQLGIHSLPERVRSDFVARARKIWLDVQTLVASGIEDGSCAAGDTEALTEVTAGTYLPLARDAVRLRSKNAHELATAICDIGAFGLRIRR